MQDWYCWKVVFSLSVGLLKGLYNHDNGKVKFTLYVPGSIQRNPALKLSSTMVELLGIVWALGDNPNDQKFLLLLIHLTCVEIRMILEHEDADKVMCKDYNGSLYNCVYFFKKI